MSYKLRKKLKEGSEREKKNWIGEDIINNICEKERDEDEKIGDGSQKKKRKKIMTAREIYKKHDKKK